MTGFYNRDGLCLLRGTDWVFNSSRRGSSPSSFGIPLSVSFHERSTLTIIYRLLLPERQMGEAWETSKKGSPFGNRGALVRKELARFRRVLRIEKSDY